MPIFTTDIPLSFYIHLPWCVRKCPYCDFNSHEAKTALPEQEYINSLLAQLHLDLAFVQNRPLVSIFFGGGTPSLFSPAGIAAILEGISKEINIDNIEITMEANPGTIDEERFKDFNLAGVNRLSIGIQSFSDEKLKALGRIHGREDAIRAIGIAQTAGFENLNLDLMYGLPDQTLEQAIADVEQALSFNPKHLSWYQLTLEPNTLFYHQPPVLPCDEALWEMQLAGQTVIADAGFQQYEVSAYAKDSAVCKHNHNYWQFGDYLGLGAGAHSKITEGERVIRFAQQKHPRTYMLADYKKTERNSLSPEDLVFEFMLNALRLTDGIPTCLFAERTGLAIADIRSLLQTAKARKLLAYDEEKIIPTHLGRQFLNNLVGIFLPG